MLAESEDGLLLDTVHYSSHSQSVCVLCSHSIVQHSLISFSDSDGVSGPSDSGGRSSSGDTGEGHLVRVKCHIVMSPVLSNATPETPIELLE